MEDILTVHDIRGCISPGISIYDTTDLINRRIKQRLMELKLIEKIDEIQKIRNLVNIVHLITTNIDVSKAAPDFRSVRNKKTVYGLFPEVVWNFEALINKPEDELLTFYIEMMKKQ